MFKICMIKNNKRTKDSGNRIEVKTWDELQMRKPDERTLPYFSVVTEQVLSDQRYKNLSTNDQGGFWRLVIHVLSQDMGVITLHAGAISQKLGITIGEWQALELALLKVEILKITDDGYYLIQPEFREQYLQTLESNNAKRR